MKYYGRLMKDGTIRVSQFLSRDKYEADVADMDCVKTTKLKRFDHGGKAANWAVKKLVKKKRR